ncbi:hypothetical protein RJ639_024179 [Escallonia herrerae]|uniref:Uncharacterized protein n=1 Tax=Escallonia herrerae TaxID=1293975 RepID=A0AA89ACN1_9ASTE|nr:hypothetical protein RJ639_024179 [Escallonia herrerae]
MADEIISLPESSVAAAISAWPGLRTRSPMLLEELCRGILSERSDIVCGSGAETMDGICFYCEHQDALKVSQEKGKKRVREQAAPCLCGTTKCAQQMRRSAVPEAVLSKGNGKDSDQLVSKPSLRARCYLPMSRSEILTINQPSFASCMKKFNVQRTMLLQLPSSFITKHCADYKNKEKIVICDIDGRMPYADIVVTCIFYTSMVL